MHNTVVRPPRHGHTMAVRVAYNVVLAELYQHRERLNLELEILEQAARDAASILVDALRLLSDDDLRMLAEKRRQEHVDAA